MIKKRKVIFWLPRLLSILFICFLTMFSFDVFEMDGPLISKILGFLIHSIPSIFLIVVLIFAWRNEMVGFVGFLLAAILYISFALSNAPNIVMALTWSLVIAGPAIMISLLFWRGRSFKKRRAGVTNR